MAVVGFKRFLSGKPWNGLFSDIFFLLSFFEGDLSFLMV
jgi:hypothetical protein